MIVKKLRTGRRYSVTAVVLLVSLVLGLPSGYAITPGEEEKLGREFLAQARQRLELVQDPLVVDGVSRVGRRLLASIPEQPFAFHFYVVKDDTLNAFAAPAGHIFVNTGLLTAVKSESELAGILAHELAHASARHISRNIEQAAVTQGLTLAGVAAGLLLGGLGGAALGQGVITGALAGGQSTMLAYSREFERQADQLGLAYLEKAGYSGKGLVDGLLTIREHDYFGGTIPSYLSTHPATTERITWLESQIEEAPADFSPAIENFRLFQTEALARYGDVTAAKSRFSRELEKTPDDPLAHYGLGVVLMRDGRRNEARDHLKAALSRQPFNIWMRAALGVVSSQMGDDQTAVAQLQDLMDTPAMSPEARYYLGNSLVNSGRPEDAVAVLNPLVRPSSPTGGSPPSINGHGEQKPDPDNGPQPGEGETPPVAAADPVTVQALYLLARAYNEMGRPADSHLYLGRHFMARGELQTAVFHLQKALTLAADDHQRETIERLLRQAQMGRPDIVGRRGNSRPRRCPHGRLTLIRRPRIRTSDLSLKSRIFDLFRRRSMGTAPRSCRVPAFACGTGLSPLRRRISACGAMGLRPGIIPKKPL
jgi:predicted Zn-dependent protease